MATINEVSLLRSFVRSFVGSTLMVGFPFSVIQIQTRGLTLPLTCRSISKVATKGFNGISTTAHKGRLRQFIVHGGLVVCDFFVLFSH